MFQSLWNVAAAFCVHENSVNTTQVAHFGHHQNTLCQSPTNSVGHTAEDTHANTSIEHDLKNKVAEDHQDHLPSMTHLLLQQNQQTPMLQTIEFQALPEFYWLNLYQAPDLFLAHPPPTASPLLVG